MNFEFSENFQIFGKNQNFGGNSISREKNQIKKIGFLCGFLSEICWIQSLHRCMGQKGRATEGHGG